MTKVVKKIVYYLLIFSVIMAFVNPITDDEREGLNGFAHDFGYHLGKTIRFPYDLLVLGLR